MVMTDRAAMLSRLARLLATGQPGLPLAHRLAGACATMLEVAGASITIEAATPNRITLAATDQISVELEGLQDVLAQGPCWDAYLTGEAQRTDLSPADDRRWPEFCPAARQAVGPRTIYGLPMSPQQDVLGVLSVHLPGVVQLPGGLEAALFLADAVGAALLLDPQQHDTPDQGGPWSGRSQVNQATGMIIAQLRIPAADALAVLRAHAYAHNTTVDDIATQIVNRDIDFGKGSE